MKNLKLIIALLFAIGLVACSSGQKKNAQGDVAVMDISVDEEAFEKQEEYKEAAAESQFVLERVHFAYDSYSLTEEARNVLARNANVIKLKKDTAVVKVYIAGHCDNRGTISYNIALGQKRATEVKNYYLDLGLKMPEMELISYGEEMPICSKNTESCWFTNRRVETKLSLR
ncbi:MAG: OmpA family protein [Elusimicrobiaceae bacterium]|jgi:peptidoglycan-associated lipoprotein|nr:OmpA family protein [Elusimicrobiaceae bacterium]MBT4008190.1 OmpA family protein [Elusimicrobiaceae bacterium]MBT4402510.1 OmpA family protein [Elusimicrobiaceae bacterium]MBT4439637.1 OmpA family protein [Elusimicrobiaceae bacterium]MBT5988069.1 OmpA family protein [Elusimicrobiaceae bacterium]